VWPTRSQEKLFTPCAALTCIVKNFFVFFDFDIRGYVTALTLIARINIPKDMPRRESPGARFRQMVNQQGKLTTK